MSIRVMQLIALAPSVLAAGACGRGAVIPDVSVIDSAGVEIVVSSGTDRELGWTLTEELRVGGKDDGPESFGSVHHSVVGVDAAGTIHVLDLAASQVHRFDSSGRHLMSFGRKGDGPGEMSWAGSLAVTPDGADMVFDFAGGRLVLWDPSGNLLPAIPIGGTGLPGQIDGALGWRGDTIGYVRSITDTAMNVKEVTLITPRDTTSLARLSVPRPRMVDFGCVGLALPPYFTSSLGMVVGDGKVATTTQTRYEVDIHSGGSLARSVRRAMAPRPASGDDVAALYPDGFKVNFGEGRACNIEITEAVEKVGIAATYPLVRRAIFSPGGGLWVQRFLPDSATPMTDVFDAAGEYLGTMSGFKLPVGFIDADRAVFPLVDEETGIAVLGIYRIDRGARQD